MSQQLENFFGPVLVGMRGSGKSTIAPIVANVLKMEFVDADLEIEAKAKMSIAEIFESKGEEHFRTLEQEILEELLNQTGKVIAAGGGAVLHDSIRKTLCQRPTFWLMASVDILASRIKQTDRPSLTGKPIDQELETILEQRKKLYSQVAGWQIDTTDESPASLAQSIAGHWKAWVDRNKEGYP
jgi:shikimate kinase